MKAKVLKFKPVKELLKSPLEVWPCDCNCITFLLYDDGAVVCAQCGTTQVGVEAWTPAGLRN